MAISKAPARADPKFSLLSIVANALRDCYLPRGWLSASDAVGGTGTPHPRRIYGKEKTQRGFHEADDPQ
jgi:hypothetical protein